MRSCTTRRRLVALVLTVGLVGCADQSPDEQLVADDAPTTVATAAAGADGVETPTSEVSATPTAAAAAADEGDPVSTSDGRAEERNESAEPTVVESSDATGEALLAAPSAMSIDDVAPWIPLEAASQLLVYRDLHRTGVAHGVDQVDCVDGAEAAFDRVMLIDERAGLTTHLLPTMWPMRDHDDMATRFGIELCHLDGWVQWRAGNAPATLFQVRGHREMVASAVEADELWSDLLDIRSHSGTTFWHWGDGLDLSFSRNSPARPNSEAGTLGFLTDRLVLRAWDEPMHHAVIDATPSGNTLRADPAIDEVLEQAAELELLGWTLRPRPDDVIDQVTIVVRADIDRGAVLAQPRFARFDWVLIGSGHDDEGGFTAMVLGHGDEALARANADRVPTIFGGLSSQSGQTWDTTFNLESTSVEGRTVTLLFRDAPSYQRHEFGLQSAVDQKANLFWIDE